MLLAGLADTCGDFVGLHWAMAKGETERRDEWTFVNVNGLEFDEWIDMIDKDHWYHILCHWKILDQICLLV